MQEFQVNYDKFKLFLDMWGEIKKSKDIKIAVTTQFSGNEKLDIFDIYVSAKHNLDKKVHQKKLEKQHS